MTSRALKLHQDILNFNRPYLADIEARLKRGDPVPDCLAKTLLLTREEEGLDDLDIIIMCGTLIIGGVETVRHLEHPRFTQAKQIDLLKMTDGVYPAGVCCPHHGLP